MDTSKRKSFASPYLKANVISKCMLWWLKDIFVKGVKNGLTEEDLYDPLKKDCSEPLGDELEKNWSKELLNSKVKGVEPSLMRAVGKTFFAQYMFWGVMVCFQVIVLRNLQPFALGYLLAYFNPQSTQTELEGYLNGVYMNLVTIVGSIFFHHCMLASSRIGMRMRVACCSLIYRKILRLNQLSLGKTATGQVVNLMSNDVNRFDIACIFFHFIWIMPLQIPLTTYLMYESVGIAAFAGVVVLIVQAVILQGYLSRYLTIMRKKIAVRTDERVKLMSELVAGIQVIKMYAWEKPFEKLVSIARRVEMKLVGKTAHVRGFSLALMVFMERTALYSTIVVYVLSGSTLHGDVVFSMAQYYNLLQFTMCIMFPYALSTFGEARISVRRLQEFMMLEEKVTKAKIIPQNGADKEASLKRSDIVLNKAKASWVPEPIIDTLSNINLRIKPGDFCAIVGPVGSGKSSLLQVLLGELPLTDGSSDLGGGSVAYSSQEPWLFVATVRQNIVFGLPFDKDRYRKVVKACSLERDFDQFPRGDQTMVGERGVSLSGGQRARINLARAVYRQSDIYLMDDPLSAVDTRVGKHLVTECINGFLADKTRILVTHQLHHLKEANNIVVLRNGQIEIQGNYDFVCKHPLFSELMNEDEEEEVEENKNELLRQRSLSESKSKSPETEQLLITEDDDEEGNNDENKELMEKGHLSGSVYIKYFKSGNGITLIIFTFVMILLAQTITTIGDLYLTAWSNNEEYSEFLDDQFNATGELKNNDPYNSSIVNLMQGNNTTPTTIMKMYMETAVQLETLSTATEPTIFGYIEQSYQDTYTALYVYTGFIVACIILTTVRSLLFLFMCIRSSIKLHDSMFSNILEATMRFFDINPSGRILNRFSKDMGAVDELLPRFLLEAIQVFMVGLGIIVMVAIKSPYMCITVIIIGLILYKMTLAYLATAQDIKRLEAITKSPVFSHLAATLNGLSTIRACGAQELLKKEFDRHQDVHSGAWYISIATNTAFGLWLSNFCCLFVCIVSFTFLIIGKGEILAGDAGVAISHSLILTGMLQHGIKQTTEVIAQMTSVERVLEYTKLPKEIGIDGPPAPPQWPKKSRLQFRGTYLRYSEGAEPVLKNLNAIVESGWKVGIVGRTGAGKSSLIAALFRLALIDGEILIDEKDTKDIKLHDLRNKISIIPQEPMLFSATLRYNLDPFSQQSDASLWQALEDVELKPSVTSLSQGVSEGGSNFSAGQRQLLCLARAIVKNNNMLVLDEATANVDPKTDSLIQKTIRQKFAHCTVLTIAHRLNTVMDSDRVLVMDQGQMIEYDHPHKLLQNPDSHLSQMVAQLGKSAEKNLREVAKAAYNNHIKFIEEPAD